MNTCIICLVEEKHLFKIEGTHLPICHDCHQCFDDSEKAKQAVLKREQERSSIHLFYSERSD